MVRFLYCPLSPRRSAACDRISSGRPHRPAAALRLSPRALFLLGATLGLATALSPAQTAHSGAAVNFGSIQVGSSSATMPVTFTFDSGGTIAVPAVLTLGAPNLDFTDAGTGTCTTNGTSHVYNAGDTCTVNVEFSPKYAGARNGAVVLSSASGTAIGYVYGTGTGPQAAFSPYALGTLGGGFGSPRGVAADGSGNIYVADYHNSVVNEMPAGCTSSACVESLGGGFVGLYGVAVDGGGNIYIADNTGIKKMPAGCGSSACVTTILTGYQSIGIAVDGSGNLYAIARDFPFVMEVPAGCSSSSCVIRLPGVDSIYGVTVDASGNVYFTGISLYVNARVTVSEIPAGCTAAGASSGACKVTALGGGFDLPEGIAVDPSGNVYVADLNQKSIKTMPAGCASSGCVATLAGGFTDPLGIALDASGNLYVADESVSQVKELQRATPPSLSFATTLIGQTSSDSPQIVTVQNIGNAALDVTNVAYATDFPEAQGIGTDCTIATPVASGASCTLSINFSPLATSATGPSTPLSETVSLTDNSGSSGGSTHQVAVSGVVVESIKPTPTITLTPSANPAFFSNPVTFTASVTSSSGTPTGTVAFYDGTTPLGSATLASGTGAYTTSSLAIGNHSITAQYSGDANFAVVTSAALTETILADTVAAHYDGTPVNFGSIQVGSSSAVSTLTFTFDYGGSIAAPAVLTLGAPNLDFTDAGTGTCTTNGISHTYNTGDTCTVDVKFSPKYAGARNGGVVLSSASGAVIATAYIYGIGTGPQVAFSPSTISMVGGGFISGTYGVAVDGGGNVYFVDFDSAVYEVPPGCASSTCVKSLVGGVPGENTWGPPAVAVDGVGNVYFSNPDNIAIKEIPAGCVSAACVTTLSSVVSNATGIAVDGAGKLYVLGDASQWGVGIFQIPPGCASITCMVLNGPINLQGGETGYGLAIDSNGNFYWSTANGVYEMAPGCASTACIASLPGSFSNAQGIVVDAGGNVYVADYGASAVKEIPAGCASSACVTTLAGGFNGASGVAVDGSGNVYASGTAEAQGMEIHRATQPSLTFASTVAGETSSDSPQTATVQNIGNTALDITGVAYPADFPEAAGISTDCASSTSLTAGGSCTLSIDFSPLASSVTGPSTPLGEFVTLTDNSGNTGGATQQVAVSGIAEESTKATPTISLTPSANPAFFSNPVTFTASVTSSSGTPTGTVAFYDGTTPLGSATLASGAAAYTTSSLAVGAHSITAQYSGDANFFSVTSAAVGETIADFTVGPPSGGSTSATVSAGGTATYMLAVTPPSGTTTPADVTFSVSGLPSGATATFSPNPVPAGSGPTNVTLKVTVPSTSAGATPASSRFPLAFGLVLLPLLGVNRRLRKRARWFAAVLLILAGSAGLVAVSGCGGGESNSGGSGGGTQSQTYTLTVTATSGSLSHATTLTLTVD